MEHRYDLLYTFLDKPLQDREKNDHPFCIKWDPVMEGVLVRDAFGPQRMRTFRIGRFLLTKGLAKFRVHWSSIDPVSGSLLNTKPKVGVIYEPA